MADPQALLVAVAAAHAVEHVGLPEAQLNLAQAVDPPGHGAEEQPRRRWRSGTPASDVRNGAVGEVPAHLRDAHYQGAASLGHGAGYEYPHDDRGAGSPSSTCPIELDRPPLLRAD